MKRTFSAIAIVLAASLLTPQVQAGAAICIAKAKTAKNNQTDVEYFLRWGAGVKGLQAQSSARQDFKARYSSTPSCRHSGALINGHLLVIKNVRKNYAGETVATYAFGFGATPGDAEQDAVRELGRRNWNWKKNEGYQVVESQTF